MTHEQQLAAIVAARAEQERLFPNKTLPQICLDVRSAITGSADAWHDNYMTQVKEMLKARLKCWHQSDFNPAWKVSHLSLQIDIAVMMMVKRTIEMIEVYESEMTESVRKDAKP